MSGAGQVVIPVVTTVASTSLPPTMSLPTLTVISPGSATHLISPNGGPPEAWHQTVMSQGARFKANRPVT